MVADRFGPAPGIALPSPPSTPVVAGAIRSVLALRAGHPPSWERSREVDLWLAGSEKKKKKASRL